MLYSGYSLPHQYVHRVKLHILWFIGILLRSIDLMLINRYSWITWIHYFEMLLLVQIEGFFMRQLLLNYQSLSIMTKMMVILAWLLSREAWTSCIAWYQHVIWYQQTSNDWGVKHVLRLNEVILSSPVLRFKQSLYPFWYFYVLKHVQLSYYNAFQRLKMAMF